MLYLYTVGSKNTVMFLQHKWCTEVDPGVKSLYAKRVLVAYAPAPPDGPLEQHAPIDPVPPPEVNSNLTLVVRAGTVQFKQQPPLATFQ